jgi:hypothetical protein
MPEEMVFAFAFNYKFVLINYQGKTRQKRLEYLPYGKNAYRSFRERSEK